MRRGLYQGVYTVVVWLTVLACTLISTPQGRAGAADDDKIILALERDQDNMDPHMHFQRVGIIMNVNMYDSLLHKTPQMAYEPSLATEWRALDDTTWELKLRQGVKFHNGDSFTAEDVQFSFARVLNPETKSPQYGPPPHRQAFPTAARALGLLPHHPQEVF
jgi:peptide/nickel transport system substrate-binding protein